VITRLLGRWWRTAAVLAVVVAAAAGLAMWTPAPAAHASNGPLGAPSVGQNSDGRLEIFSIGPDGGLWHDWQCGALCGWSGWHSLGGNFFTNPAIGQDHAGQLHVFVVSTAGAMYHYWHNPPAAGGGWGVASLGSPAPGLTGNSPAVARNTDGHLEIFASSGDGAIWHNWQCDGCAGGWSGWFSLGGNFQIGPVVATTPGSNGENGTGAIEIFAADSNGTLWHNWQCGATCGWSGWHSLGGQVFGEPVVGRNSNGQLEVFSDGQDGLDHIWQCGALCGWSAWSSLGGPGGFAAVTQNSDGRLEVFKTALQTPQGPGNVWHAWQCGATCGWSGWNNIGGQTDPFGGIDVGRNSDGRLEAFTLGQAGSAVVHAWQCGTCVGGWSAWSSLGTPG